MTNFTYENTKDATHAKMVAGVITLYKKTKNNNAHLDHMFFDTYLVCWSHSGVYRDYSKLIDLSRPHNETREYWTTKGVTQYAQGNKMDTKVNENTNQAKLWKIIDDIDTFSDQIKPTELKGYKRYFEAVNGMVGKRFQVLESDGYNLFELGSMPKSCKKTAAPSGARTMNTDKLIQISYVKKFTPLIVGDGWANTYTGATGVIAEHDLFWFNEYANTSGLYIASFADRPNTGKQPVGVGVVDCNWSDGDTFVGRRAGSFSWGLSEHASNVITWKPNHAAMLKQYQAEQALQKLSVGDVITVNSYDELPDAVITKAKEKETPVFTKAMADAGELPPIGSKALLTQDGIFDKGLKEGDEVLIGGHANFGGGKVAVFCKVNGNNTGTGIESMFKPIQTDEDKAVDAMFVEMNTKMQLRGNHDDYMVNDDTQVGVEFVIEYMAANGFKWVGSE